MVSAPSLHSLKYLNWDELLTPGSHCALTLALMLSLLSALKVLSSHFSPVDSQGIWITHCISSTMLSSGATLEDTSDSGLKESPAITMSLTWSGRSWTDKNPVNTRYLNCVEGDPWLQDPEEDLSMAPGMFVMHKPHKGGWVLKTFWDWSPLSPVISLLTCQWL